MEYGLPGDTITRSFNTVQATTSTLSNGFRNVFSFTGNTSSRVVIWQIRLVNPSTSDRRVSVLLNTGNRATYVVTDTIPRESTFTPITKNNPLFMRTSDTNPNLLLRFTDFSNGQIYCTAVYDYHF